MENDEEKKQPDPLPDRAADAASGAVEATVAKLEMVAAEPEPAESRAKAGEPALVRAAYEHPLLIRITHWITAISLFVLVASGLRIFRAFPSFGPKIPEKVLLDVPKSLTLGGWLGGALQWHFTFMWLFAGSGVVYVVYTFVHGTAARMYKFLHQAFRIETQAGVSGVGERFQVLGLSSQEKRFAPARLRAHT